MIISRVLMLWICQNGSELPGPSRFAASKLAILLTSFGFFIKEKTLNPQLDATSEKFSDFIVKNLDKYPLANINICIAGSEIIIEAFFISKIFGKIILTVFPAPDGAVTIIFA